MFHFTKREYALWIGSLLCIVIAFLLFDRTGYLSLIASSIGVTALFYPILRHFHTANLLPSTLSVTTSFLAVYLTFRRNSFFALAYAANDVILILLWWLASQRDPSYIPITVCFAVFLINDLYGFFAWRKMQYKQTKTERNA